MSIRAEIPPRPLLLAALLTLAVPLGATSQGIQAVPSSGIRASIAGTVVDAGGDPVPGALVTARHTPSGRAFTVYAGQSGRFVLSGLPEDTLTLEIRGPRAEATPRTTMTGRTDALGGNLTLGPPAARDEPPASSFLAQLPDGPEKNRFIVDCGGCHAFSSFHARKDGGDRTEEQWRLDITRMLSFAGPASGFPIISTHARPAADAAWLSAALAGAPWPSHPTLADGTLVNTGARLTEFAIPEPADLPHDLAVAADGRIVITGMFTHRMYVLDPSTGAYETVAIPVEGANPRAVDVDAEGRWIVALGGPRTLAVFTPSTGAWTTQPVGAYPHSVALDGRGGVWFNGHFSVAPEVVGRYDRISGEVTRFQVPPTSEAAREESSIQYGLRVAPDGTVWSTQLRGNHLVRLDPASGETDAFALPSPNGGPRRPDIAPDGTVWIPEFGAGKLARFDPVTEEFREYELPVEDAGPYVVRVDGRRGTVWLGTGHADLVLAFDPMEETFTAYPLPTRGALIRHLDIEEDTGAVWAAYGASPGIPGKVLRIQP